MRELSEVLSGYAEKPHTATSPRRTTGLVVNDDMTTCLVECDVWGTAWRDRRVRARNGKPTPDSSSPGRSSVRRSRGVAERNSDGSNT